MQYIFIIYGAVTILVGAVLFVALPDSPSQAWFFNEEEKKLAIVRLASNQTGIETQKKVGPESLPPDRRSLG